jgi:hypothetical protein
MNNTNTEIIERELPHYSTKRKNDWRKKAKNASMMAYKTKRIHNFTKILKISSQKESIKKDNRRRIPASAY